MAKAYALIESNFGINANELSDEDFAVYGSRAIWLEAYRAELAAAKLSEVLGKMFGG